MTALWTFLIALAQALFPGILEIILKKHGSGESDSAAPQALKDALKAKIETRWGAVG